MFDLATEPPIPLAEAVKLIPPARSGKATHLSTLIRWILTGVKSPTGEVVRLEGIRIGARWMTSRAAIQRFADRLNPHPNGSSAPTPRTPAQRQRASERAATELENEGI
jgi:hypothetical protein